MCFKRELNCEYENEFKFHANNWDGINKLFPYFSNVLNQSQPAASLLLSFLEENSPSATDWITLFFFSHNQNKLVLFKLKPQKTYFTNEANFSN